MPQKLLQLAASVAESAGLQHATVFAGETSQAIVPVPIGMSAQPALQEERIVLRKGGCDIELSCTIAPEYIAALAKALANA